MELLARVDELIEARHLLTHPFYRKWVDGTLPPENLREYTRQYFAFESTFPRFLSALHSRSDRPDVRAALLDNLWDEEQGEANHAELWLRFAEGVGVQRDDVSRADRNASTRALIDGYWGSSTRAPVAAGVAAVYAYERQVPAVASAKIDGLERHYGIHDERTLGFFRLHAELDVEHSRAERAMIGELGTECPDEVLGATEAATDAWWDFLTAVDA